MKIDDMNDYKDLDVVEREDECPEIEELVDLNIKGKVDDGELLYEDDANTPEYIASKAEIEMQIEILKDMCIKAKKPLFVSVAMNPKVTKEDGTLDTEYITNALIPYTLGVKLHKDLISPMLLVMQGFKVRSDIPMDYDLSEEESTAMADVETTKNETCEALDEGSEEVLNQEVGKSSASEKAKESFVDKEDAAIFGFESVHL